MIALLSILLGAVVLVIDVPTQRMRARQAVGRENIAKACAAFAGCVISSQSGEVGDCSNWGRIGVVEPLSPEGALYVLGESGPSVSVDGCSISCNNQGMLNLTDEVGGICFVR
mgnify:CR=1 FL=1